MNTKCIQKGIGDGALLLKETLPKHFDVKCFDSLVSDLEDNVRAANLPPKIVDVLDRAFALARSAIRSRSGERLATLSDEIKSQCILSPVPDRPGLEAYCFYILYQLGSFLKKYPFTGIDTRQAAFRTFKAAEKQCHLFNTENWKALYRIDQSFHPILGGSIQSIRRDIEKLLGKVPNLARIEELADHGPGKAFGPLYEQGKTTSYYKWSTLPYTVTKAARSYAKNLIEKDSRWLGALNDSYRNRERNLYGPIDIDLFWDYVFEIVPGSRITTVPKSALTDRTIAIEPMLNVFLQLGVDKEIKSRLKNFWKIDLSTQEKNQRLAQDGARDGTYATIDLKAASDTVSLRICELLLPVGWYNLLLDLRSPIGVLGDEQVTFEKISSMGNGYTFALESLIFSAVVRHCLSRLRNRGDFTVFGDDIVVPTETASCIIEMLEYMGFSINSDKSFLQGPFRESCGSDWFHRYAVRPFFLTKKTQTVMDIFYIHNNSIRIEDTLDWTWEISFPKLRHYVLRYIPGIFQNIRGPKCESLDTHLFSAGNSSLEGQGSDRWHLVIIPVARSYPREQLFFFRKLMARLDGRPDPSSRLNFWESKREIPRTSGNAFDVTRRGYVHYKCTKKVVSYGHNLAPLAYLTLKK